MDQILATPAVVCRAQALLRPCQKGRISGPTLDFPNLNLYFNTLEVIRVHIRM